jgi:hypothetical protein
MRTSRLQPPGVLLDQELLEHWMSGDAIAGVEFGLSQPVVIRSGPGASHVGTIVALVSLDPEPVYTVKSVRDTGTSTSRSRRWLRPNQRKQLAGLPWEAPGGYLMPTPNQTIAQLESTVAALEAAGGNEALITIVRAQLEQARRALAEGRPIDLAQLQEPDVQSSGEGGA